MSTGLFLSSDYAFGIVQAGSLRAARNYVVFTGQTLLSYEVVPPRMLASQLCYCCGKRFEDPEYPGCGTEVIVEITPEGDRLYHRECKPERPWYYTVVRNGNWDVSKDDELQPRLL